MLKIFSTNYNVWFLFIMNRYKFILKTGEFGTDLRNKFLQTRQI